MRRIRTDIARMIAGLAMAGAPAMAWAGPVTIAISGVPDAHGMMNVAICRKDEFLKAHCAIARVVPSHPGVTQAVFADVPPGVYAVQVFQDRNDDRKLDRSFLGIPTEPVGFSRDPHLRFGPPSFDQCALRLSPAGGTIGLDLITH